MHVWLTGMLSEKSRCSSLFPIRRGCADSGKKNNFRGMFYMQRVTNWI